MFMSTLSSRRDDARLNDDDRERDAGRCAHGDAGLDDDWSAAREHSRRANDPLRGHAGAAGHWRKWASRDDVRRGERRDGLAADEHARKRRGRSGLSGVRAENGRAEVYNRSRHVSAAACHPERSEGSLSRRGCGTCLAGKRSLVAAAPRDDFECVFGKRSLVAAAPRDDFERAFDAPRDDFEWAFDAPRDDFEWAFDAPRDDVA